MDKDLFVMLFLVGFGSLYALVPLWLAVAAYKSGRNALIWGVTGLLLSFSAVVLCVVFINVTEFGSTLVGRFGPLAILFFVGLFVAALIGTQINSRVLRSGVGVDGHMHRPVNIWVEGVPVRVLVQLTFAILGLALAIVWLLGRLAPHPGAVGGVPYPISIVGILGCGGYVLSSSSSIVGCLRSDRAKRSQWARILPAAILLVAIMCTLGGWWWWQDFSRDQALMREIQDAPYIPE